MGAEALRRRQRRLASQPYASIEEFYTRTAVILRMVSIPLPSVAERLFSIAEMVEVFNPAAAANCC